MHARLIPVERIRSVLDGYSLALLFLTNCFTSSLAQLPGRLHRKPRFHDAECNSRIRWLTWPQNRLKLHRRIELAAHRPMQDRASTWPVLFIRAAGQSVSFPESGRTLSSGVPRQDSLMLRIGRFGVPLAHSPRRSTPSTCTGNYLPRSVC